MMDEKAEKKDGTKLFAVVRLRGSANTDDRSKDALQKLRLSRPNNCTLVQADDTHKGMLMHLTNYVTWGEINEEMLSRLLEKRGKDKNGGKLDAKKAKSMAQSIFKNKTPAAAGIRPVFRLSPPSHGLRSVRLQYPRGDMGARGEKINDLLLRMI
jgi:large subunit ribosomal protein L30